MRGRRVSPQSRRRISRLAASKEEAAKREQCLAIGDLTQTTSSTAWDLGGCGGGGGMAGVHKSRRDDAATVR